MERGRVNLEVTSIVIEEAKEGYIATKGVQFADVLEVFMYAPRFFRSVTERGERFAMLGSNQTNRYLLTAIARTANTGEWRVVSAYWLRANRGRRLYEED